MPLAFPIADTARAALDADADAGVRSLAEAAAKAGRPVSLVSEWLRPAAAEQEEIKGKAEAALARGFVQIYEDAKGGPVIAVSFWKPQPVQGKAKGKAAAKTAAVAAEDHTDDLYFAKPSSRTKRRKRTRDPNQLDLFTGPDQKGHESRDPHNPGVVIVDEEGDGAAFGLAPAPPRD